MSFTNHPIKLMGLHEYPRQLLWLLMGSRAFLSDLLRTAGSVESVARVSPFARCHLDQFTKLVVTGNHGKALLSLLYDERW